MRWISKPCRSGAAVGPVSGALAGVFRWTLILSVVCSLGLPWAFLQSIAWTGMIIRYSRDGSLTEAVSKTFDGNHLCPLCKAIRLARAEEKQKDAKQSTKPGMKLDPGSVWQAADFYFAPSRDKFFPSDCEAHLRSNEPPTPPPRTA